MNKFGQLKTKILQKLTEAYASENKGEIKKILQTVTKNKDFRDLYLFYEEIENKYFENPEDAKQYLMEIRSLLIEKTLESRSFCESLDKKIGDVKVEENELYSYLDTFASRRRLKNADQHVVAKNKLVEHLTTKKETPILTEMAFTENENLLHAVLTNNFNILYGNTLNEEQKEELKKILSISNKELETTFSTLKEEVTKKLSDMYADEKNEEAKTKINLALTEAERMKTSKFNYYKLSQLKNGL